MESLGIGVARSYNYDARDVRDTMKSIRLHWLNIQLRMPRMEEYTSECGSGFWKALDVIL